MKARIEETKYIYNHTPQGIQTATGLTTIDRCKIIGTQLYEKEVELIDSKNCGIGYIGDEGYVFCSIVGRTLEECEKYGSKFLYPKWTFDDFDIV